MTNKFALACCMYAVLLAGVINFIDGCITRELPHRKEKDLTPIATSVGRDHCTKEEGGIPYDTQGTYLTCLPLSRQSK